MTLADRGSGSQPAWDVAVVGSGIAGLTAALRLAHRGLSTVVLERAPRAGGKCGTFEVDGFEFVVGCNDFGAGFAAMLAELGVAIEFTHPLARFHFAGHRIQLPPDPRTGLALARRAVGLGRLFRAARRATTLGELIDGSVSDPLLRDLACLPAYAMMRSPDDVGVSELRAILSKELGYGYERSHTPVGGPQALIDAMVSRLRHLGGDVCLGEEVLAIEHGEGRHRLRTGRRELVARRVISSIPRPTPASPESRPGLELATVLLVVRTTCPFPPKLHTLDWFPADVPGMLRSLEAGERVERLPVHSFRSRLGIPGGCYTMNAFVPLPRGEPLRETTATRTLATHVRRTLDQLIPGLDRAIVRAHVLSPDAYAERLGFRPRLSPLVRPVGMPEPESYDPDSGIHHVGTGVQPPGEHAGAAALSGWRAADEILERHEPVAPSNPEQRTCTINTKSLPTNMT